MSTTIGEDPALPEDTAVDLGTVPIDDLNQFAHLIFAWHQRKIATLNQLKDIPEGAEFQVGDEPPFKLEGDKLVGFRFGIEMALMEVGTLPFVAEADNGT